MNDMPIEDQIILREMIVNKAETISKILAVDNNIGYVDDRDVWLNKLRICRDAIIILNGPISEWYKENPKPPSDKDNHAS